MTRDLTTEGAVPGQDELDLQACMDAHPAGKRRQYTVEEIKNPPCGKDCPFKACLVCDFK